jgi:hypothetical protein
MTEKVVVYLTEKVTGCREQTDNRSDWLLSIPASRCVAPRI